MQTYSPFDKSIDDLQPADLAILKNVSEGWYVEYKSEMINASALAKAVSAFANTFGGWLFLGVKEQGKDGSGAGAFPGIPKKDVDGVLQRLRHSAAQHLNPTPTFQTKVLSGPCDETGLIAGASVVAIEIPQSHITPHVHKDGRIYRRVADGSEPKPETDRFILDQLWRRDEPIRERVREWVKRDPEFSQVEEKIPYVRLLFCVDPWFQKDIWLSTPLSEIRGILAAISESGSVSVPFDTFYSTAEGFVARQVKGNDPDSYGTTCRIRRDMSCDVVLPLPLYAPGNDLASLVVELDGYDHKARFIRILKEQGHTQPRIADLNFLMNLLIGVVSKYRHLLRLADISGEFYFKARALNVWRVAPFVDIETALDEFEVHGLPVVLDTTATFPAGYEPESFDHIAELGNEKRATEVQAALQAAVVFALVVRLFGIDISDRAEKYYSEVIDTGKRAMIVQQNRNRRRFEI